MNSSAWIDIERPELLHPLSGWSRGDVNPFDTDGARMGGLGIDWTCYAKAVIEQWQNRVHDPRKPVGIIDLEVARRFRQTNGAFTSLLHAVSLGSSVANTESVAPKG